MMNDTIFRSDAIALASGGCHPANLTEELAKLPSAQSEEVIPHQNYKYLSDYWCSCGWHLGKKGEVKYCADCGRRVNWDG